MERVWYYQDQEGVVAALKLGERPDLATTMGCGRDARATNCPAFDRKNP